MFKRRKLNAAVLLAFIIMMFLITPAWADNGLNVTGVRNSDGTVTIKWYCPESYKEYGTKLNIAYKLNANQFLWIDKAEVPATDEVFIDDAYIAMPDAIIYYKVWSNIYDGVEITVEPYKEVPPQENSGESDQNPDGHGGGNNDGPLMKNMDNTSFNAGWWNIVMQWYNTLVTLSGVFIFIVIVRSGYKYYHSSIDPSIRASLLMDVQRCFLAMLLIVITPFLIYGLMLINNVLVELFKTITENIQKNANVNIYTGNTGSPTGFFDKIVASPFQIIVDIFNKLFGLVPLDKLIFNISSSGSSLLLNLSGQSIFGNIQTDNVFATALLNLCMLGFNVYFNALYSIRFWIITAAFVGTPIIIWIWAFKEERQILETWGSEIFSTIFMQTFHALTFGAFFSVAVASKYNDNKISLLVNTTKSVASTTAAGATIQSLGLWFAGLGGALCALILLNASIKMIASRGQEKSVAEATESLSKAIIGAFVLGMSMMIAGLLIYIFNGNW
jgi:hypothetical protein